MRIMMRSQYIIASSAVLVAEDSSVLDIRGTIIVAYTSYAYMILLIQ